MNCVRNTSFFFLQHKRIDLEFDDDVDNIDINELERKMPKKGPLYEFIKYYINGNNERIAKMSLQEYYILSSAEDLLFQCDPNSEWTYRYPEDISASSDVPQAGASPSDVNKFQFRNKIEDIGRHLGSDQMAGTYPLPGRNFPQTQREPDERNNFSNSIIGITGRPEINKFKILYTSLSSPRVIFALQHM